MCCSHFPGGHHASGPDAAQSTPPCSLACVTAAIFPALTVPHALLLLRTPLPAHSHATAVIFLAFTVPKVYEMKQKEIDQVLDLAKGKLQDVYKIIDEKVLKSELCDAACAAWRKASLRTRTRSGKEVWKLWCCAVSVCSPGKGGLQVCASILSQKVLEVQVNNTVTMHLLSFVFLSFLAVPGKSMGSVLGWACLSRS